MTLVFYHIFFHYHSQYSAAALQILTSHRSPGAHGPAGPADPPNREGRQLPLSEHLGPQS